LPSHALSLALLAASLVALAPEPAAAASPPAKSERSRLAALEKVVRDELRATRTPGAAVVVIAGGRVVYSRGFGTTSVEGGALVTPSTLFRLGSTTKMLTGAAMVALADRGKLRLDAPIGDYAKGLAPKLAALTAHRLLSNSAGVADFAAPLVSHDDASLGAVVRGWKDDVLFGEPGRVYSYASPGFWLAGHVLEQAGGKPYADMMDELVFAPAGMTRTTLRPLVAMTYPLALGHQSQDGNPTVIRPAFDNTVMWPAGSVFSTADDLSQFVLTLFGKGGKQALPANLLTAMSGQYIAMPGAPDVHYGYGLLNFEHRGVRVIMHGGFSRGYGSMLQMVPAHGFAVIVLTNRSGETLPRTTQKAQELFLPLTPEQQPARHAQPLTPEDVRRFAGVYVNGEQTWEIRPRGGKLELVSAGEAAALVKTDTWRLSHEAALDNDVAFVAGPDGRAEYVFTGMYAGRRRPEPAARKPAR
jgi:CubicO group peptidase (beta-lactamase class C family)